MRLAVRVLTAFALMTVAASAQAPRRVALIVANANYAGYAPLPNTAVDAGLVADAFRRAGFSTVAVEADQGIAAFRTALGVFQTRAQGAEVAAIYYAGHGVEVGGRNWLIPTDARLENDEQLAFQAIDANLLIQAASGARTRIVVLDACRENPFAGRMRRTGRLATRDVAPGLAAPIGEGARGTLLMYSAAPGELAADGVAGSGSPFARAFARFIPERGVELRVAAGKIADFVFDETAQAQLPFTSSSLSGAEIYLVAGARSVAPDPELERLRRDNEELRRSGTKTSATVDRASQPPPPAPKTRPGERFAECTGCPEMIVIAGGTFSMGSPTSEAGRGLDEMQRTVSVRTFAAGRTEVTFAQWDACVSGGGCVEPEAGPYTPNDQGSGRGDRPVILVSWQDARRYVHWLNGQVGGKAYRLLSEAEWEYAARAGAGSVYAWGDVASHDDANYGGDNGYGATGGRDRWMNSAPVGSFPPNAFGLHDMHGNVWEWVQDCYGDYGVAPRDGSAKEQDCTARVFRGGSFDFAPIGLRSAARLSSAPANRGLNVGFRVARSL